MAQDDSQKTSIRFTRNYGLSMVLLGFVTFMLSRVFDRGFIHGLFQGMTVALMVLAVYLIARSARRGTDEDKDLWRPSEGEK